MKIIYVAGPYRADTEWGLVENIRKAEVAAIKLWQEGWAVICPHKNSAHFGGLCPDDTWLKGDIEILKRCDAIYMMKDWEKSKGARHEHDVAFSYGLERIYE